MRHTLQRFRRALKSAAEPPDGAVAQLSAVDYHALDRLYDLESEERQERRGLETRAGATIAAALASVAFSANAVSSQISEAGLSASVLLAIGAALLLVGIAAATVNLFGRSKFALLITALLARAGQQAREHERSSLRGALDRRRDARKRGDPDGVRAANRDVNLALVHYVTGALPGPVTRLPLDLALILLESRASEAQESGEVQVTPSSRKPVSLREPSDLEAAIDAADLEVLRLREENVAAVTILRWTSLLLGLGIVVLSAGVVTLLVDAPAGVGK